MARKDWKQALQIPIGIIPAGTMNGLAVSIGLNSPEVSLFPIIKG